MTSRGHALSRDALIRTLTAYSGITTEDGEADGTTLVDTNLKNNPSISPSGIPEKTILILSGDARGEDKGSASFNNVTGAITLQGTGFSAEIKAGTIFRILNISTTEIDVARIEAKVDIIDGVVDSIIDDYLNHGVHGLAAMTALINACGGTLIILNSRTESMMDDYLNHGVHGLAAIAALVNACGGGIHDLRSNLVRWGQISAVSGNTFTTDDLAGLGIDAMPDWWVYVMQADDAAPEGEYRMMTDYTNEGVVSHQAFSTALEIGDRVQLIHPVLYAAIAMRGGTETLESLDDELDAIPDMAKVPDTRTPSVIGTEETITALGVTGVVPFYVAGIWLGMENMAAGDVVRWRVFVDWDDASIADQLTDDEVWTFGGVQPQKWTYMPLNFWVTYEIAVKVTQLDGTAKALHCVLDTGQRGS